MKLSLNADLGESFGAYTMGDDAALMSLISDANIACGFHAGDPAVLLDTLALCAANEVGIGAHPSWADLQGFGRRPMQYSEADTRALLLYQLAVVDGLARLQGKRLQHVKPHGAMNNQAATDSRLANCIAAACHEYDPTLILLAPAASALAVAGQTKGLRVALEVFADRRYDHRGALLSRAQPDALIESSEAAIDHALAMLDAQAVISVDGTKIDTAIHSICVHGDNPHAVATARALRQALIGAGYTLAPLATH